jgi:hypothetical protein
MATIDHIPNELVEADAALAIRAGVTVENGLRLSIAISLKRLADALESQAQIAAIEAAYKPGNGFPSDMLEEA